MKQEKNIPCGVSEQLEPFFWKISSWQRAHAILMKPSAKPIPQRGRFVSKDTPICTNDVESE